MGCYYLTMSVPVSKGDGMRFSSLGEVLMAYASKAVGTHAKIKLRLPRNRRLRADLETDGGFARTWRTSSTATVIIVMLTLYLLISYL
jgi:hypothetical protein